MQRKKIIALATVGFIAMFLIGIVFAVQVYNLNPNYLGFWGEEERNTNLIILNVKHVIISFTEIKTTLDIENPTDETINFDLTIFYKNNSSDILATYELSNVIQKETTNTYSWEINVIVEQWTETTFSIDADY